MLHTIALCDPFTKSQLFHSFGLSLYGSAPLVRINLSSRLRRIPLLLLERCSEIVQGTTTIMVIDGGDIIPNKIS